MGKILNFRDLELWKLGKEIVLDVYRATGKFPRGRNVWADLTDASRGRINPFNVAEGFNRKHNPEYRQLLYVALGSGAEPETQIEVAHDLGFLSVDDRDKVLEKLDHESRMLSNLIKRL